MATTLRRPAPTGNGNAVPPFDLEPPKATRKPRMPEVLLGLLIVVVFALGGVLWVSSSGASRQVLALRHDVKRGTVVERDDLMRVSVGTDDPVSMVPVSDVGSIIGKRAAVDLQKGTLVTVQQFVDAPMIEPGTAIVGLRLEPGELPSSTLRAGDHVHVVSTGDPTNKTEGQVLARDVAVIDSVADGSDESRRFVSLEVSEEKVVEVSTAASAKQLRLVQVPEG